MTLTFNGIKAVSLAPHLEREDVVLVKLEVTDARGQLISENLYWQARDARAHRRLGTMPPQELVARATVNEDGAETRVEHKGTVPALAIKLTLLDGRGQRILPAYYADNYVSLLPGESREVVVALPASRLPDQRWPYVVGT